MIKTILRTFVSAAIVSLLTVTSSISANAVTVRPARGSHYVAIILMRTPGTKGRLPRGAWTPRQAVNMLANGHGSIHDWFAHASIDATRHPAISVTGRIYPGRATGVNASGYYRSPGSLAVPASWRPGSPMPNACKMKSWINAGIQQAKKYDHFNPSAFQHIIVYSPKVRDQNGLYDVCHVDGKADSPGKYIWLNGSHTLSTFIHEIGHNLGLMHAGRFNCGNGPVNSSCLAPYGDANDPMGCDCTRFYNAEHKYMLGWVRPGQVDTYSVREVGTTHLTSSSIQAPGTQVLMHVMRKDGYYYAVERRTPANYDTGKNLVGVWIRLVKPINVRVGEGHVDVGADDTEVVNNGRPLSRGQTFSDPSNSLFIYYKTDVNGYAMVEVNHRN
jgi:hypothetical protein